MEKFKVLVGVFIGLCLSFLGGVDKLLVALFGFIVLDFVTGMLNSALMGKWSSKVGYKGVIKKISYFIMVGFAHLIDTYIMHGADYKFRALGICLILANEGISIIENLAELGVPIPRKLIILFEGMKKDDEKINLKELN